MMHLGIDLGTSGVKAVLTKDGTLLDQATVPLAVATPHQLWSEQDPAAWWHATVAALQQLGARHDLSAVRGIGLTGQMHGAVLLDAGDKVLRPAILWNDGRSDAECHDLERAEPRSRAITGNLAMPGFTAPKLLWVRRHEPELFAGVRRVLLPKDFLRLRMTGEAISDMSDASGTLWLDVGHRRWSPEMLAASGLSEQQMPRLVEGTAIGGTLRPEAAQTLSLPAGIPVAGGGGDNAAGAAGIGCVAPGDAFVSLGTSGVIFVSDPSFLPDPERTVHAFCHCVPRHLASHVGHTIRGRVAGLVRRGERHRRGDVAGRGRTRSAAPPPGVPALFVGRAHTAQQSRRVRRIFRPVQQHHPRRDDAGGAGGCGVRAGRWTRCAGSAWRPDHGVDRHRRRIA
jgi:xylulokinase